MMTDSIPNFDDKIGLVIGGLLAKADSISKTVLSAFDPSKDLEANAKVLGGSRFTPTVLDTCAQFLNIRIVDQNESRIFTNKPSLARRIILEIQSYYPAICSGCDTEYSVEFDSDSPALRCFLCFQGCHDCSSFTSPDLSSSPSGTVWLCRSCHMINNPVKQKKSKTKSGSTPGSKVATGSNTPVQSEPKVSFSADVLSHRLSEISHQQQQSQQLPSGATGNTNPNTRPDICEKLKVGKCPHGISGKTQHNGRACDKFHPKWCYRFARNGRKGKYGCRKGDKCLFYHPKHCPSSVSDKTCLSEECTLVHLVGTKRHRFSEEQSYRRSDRQRSRSGDSNRDSNRNARSGQNNIPRRSRNESQSEGLQDIGNFLELRSLLTSFQENFQKEIQSLKSDIASQETKLASLMPSFSQHVIKQFLPQATPGHMSLPFHQSLPQSHLQQPHPLQQTMNWHQFPASGC